MTVELLNDGNTDSEPREPGPAYAIRQGVVMLTVSCDDRRPIPTLLGDVCDALKADSRVRSFTRPPHRDHTAFKRKMYPRVGRGTKNEESALYGADHTHAITFSDPLLFQIALAPEDQEEFWGVRDFPKGDYFCAWDGTALIVLWEQSSMEPVSKAAGRVVYDILSDAAQRANAFTMIQPCSPGCHNRFTHTDCLMVRAENRSLKASSSLVVIESEALRDPQEEALRHHTKVYLQFAQFAKFKNHARRIRDLSELSNRRLSSLLMYRQQHQAIALESKPIDRIKSIRDMRGWRKRSRKAIADVWLTSAAIEVMRSNWDEDRSRFKNSLRSKTHSDLFALDYSDDEIAVDNIDLGLSRAALAQASTGLDTRVLTIATAASGCAALVGGVIGALIGAA